eukprot:258880-Prymnesium_polylepis.2
MLSERGRRVEISGLCRSLPHPFDRDARVERQRPVGAPLFENLAHSRLGFRRPVPARQSSVEPRLALDGKVDKEADVQEHLLQSVVLARGQATGLGLDRELKALARALVLAHVLRCSLRPNLLKVRRALLVAHLPSRAARFSCILSSHDPGVRPGGDRRRVRLAPGCSFRFDHASRALHLAEDKFKLWVEKGREVLGRVGVVSWPIDVQLAIRRSARPACDLADHAIGQGVVRCRRITAKKELGDGE